MGKECVKLFYEAHQYHPGINNSLHFLGKSTSNFDRIDANKQLGDKTLQVSIFAKSERLRVPCACYVKPVVVRFF